MVPLMLCYYSVAACSSKGDISASAICHLWRFILVEYIGNPNRLPVAAL